MASKSREVETKDSEKRSSFENEKSLSKSSSRAE